MGLLDSLNDISAGLSADVQQGKDLASQVADTAANYRQVLSSAGILVGVSGSTPPPQPNGSTTAGVATNGLAAVGGAITKYSGALIGLGCLVGVGLLVWLWRKKKK